MWIKHFQNIVSPVAFLTRSWFADSGVFRAKLVTLHAQTVEAAVRVNTALRAGIGACALINVHTGLPIIFKTEAWVASALWGGKAQKRYSKLLFFYICVNVQVRISWCFLTLKPILRSSQSWEHPLSLLFRHSLMKQFSSSEPSPQSSLRSQSNVSFTQFPLLQAYVVSLHFFSVPWNEMKNGRYYSCIIDNNMHWCHYFQCVLHYLSLFICLYFLLP